MTLRERRLAPEVCVLLAGLVLCQAGQLRAATFSVNPTQVYLSAKVTTALVSLRNESGETLRFQLTLYAWDQAPNGEMKLAPTDDIVFFPRLLTLAPKEERRVRVGTSRTPGAIEQSYRLFVEELPSSQAEATPGAVRVLTKMSIPIFLQPATPAPAPLLENVAVRAGRAAFAIRNAGTGHFVPDAITIEGVAADGHLVFSLPVNGWYVLAGGHRQYDIDLPRTGCAEVASVAVSVRVGQSAFTRRIQTAPGGPCRP